MRWVRNNVQILLIEAFKKQMGSRIAEDILS